MAETLRLPYPPTSSRIKQKYARRYLFIYLAANTLLWASAFLYVKIKQPTYTSDWTVTLPNANLNTNVSLPGIGQASTEVNSPYSSKTQDPRENYKFIALSRPVLTTAAAQLNMSLKEFGKPRVEIIDNSTLMSFAVTAPGSQEAYNKAVALYKALEIRLQELRTQAVALQNASSEAALSTSRTKLQVAQQRLSDYKARSGFSSQEQITQLSANIEELRRERAQVLAQNMKSSASLGQLSNNLRASAQQATEAFSLQTDPIFQRTLSDYSKSSAVLTNLTSKFTANSPAVINEKANRDATLAVLLSRSRSLLGRPVTLQYVEQLNLNNTVSAASPREQLFQELVSTQSEQQGLNAQAQEVDRQLTTLDNRLKTLVQQAATVDDLQRDVQIAEAVFSSTLTNLDLGQSDIFGSYPRIQLITQPSSSQNPTAPNIPFIFLGTSLGSFFITAGLISLWLRRKGRLPERAEARQPRAIPS